MHLWFLSVHVLWFLGHFYVARALITPLEVSVRGRVGLWIGAVFLALLLPLTFFLDGLKPYRWVGYVYMGVFALVFFASLARDLLRIQITLVDWLRARLEPSPPVQDRERRRFLFNATNAGLLATSGLASTWGYREAVAPPDLEEVVVFLPNLPPAFDGYRIVQLSDLHIGQTIRGDFVRAVVERVNALQPDLVAITGDLVDGTVAELRAEVAPLAGLRSTDGTFFVTGNHEHYSGASAWVRELRRTGLEVLLNEHRVVARRGARLLVAGCTDHRTGEDALGLPSDPVRARRGAPSCEVSLLLAHQPQSYRGALRARYDLMLAGHTHGGQFFPITLLAGYAHPFVAGLHRVDGMQIYVNRGTGYWGPPMRVGVASEITLLTLRSEASAGSAPPTG